MNNKELKELKDYLSCSKGFKRLELFTLVFTIVMGLLSLTLLGACIYARYAN
jgi:hypothetical protein